MQVMLIRHGETIWQKERRYQGISDVPLSEEARRSLIRSQEQPENVYVTSLLRTKETASILFPHAVQIIVSGLEEMNFGVFEGRTAEEMAEDPRYRAWVDSMCLDACPGGESKDACCNRVCDAFLSLLEAKWSKEQERIVIVAHGGTQMAVLERFAEEKKPYYDWQLPCGMGYLLNVDMRQNGPVLQVQDVVSYVR